MATVNATVRLGLDPTATADVPTAALKKVGIYDSAGHPIDLNKIGKDGQPRFTGHGLPPEVLTGATHGDLYLDIDTGNLYQLS